MSKAEQKWARRLRQANEDEDAIHEWVNKTRRRTGKPGRGKLCRALSECVSELSSYTRATSVRNRKRDAADTIAYIREILEK